jgi:CRP/FNR family transcriptional regulator, cyclic AMP receptor protein
MLVHKDAKVEAIRSVPLFARLSKRELEDVAQLADEIDLPEGRTLMRQGERGQEFFVLLDGTVSVEQDGKELRTLGPGDFFGEIALVSRGERTATVTTTAPSRALVVSDQGFRSLISRSPAIQEKVLEALAERSSTS